jgi:Tol biopolymer transport system component
VGHAPIEDLYVMNVDGTGVERLTESSDCGGNGVADPAWSPDGTRIVFSMPHPEGTDCWFDLFSVSPDGTGLIQLTETLGREGGSDWSPDGTRIVFDRYGEGSSTDVFVIDADGTGETRVTDDPADDARPAWSPDGTMIVFSSHRNDDGSNVLGEGDPGNAEIYVMDADGSDQTRLTDDPAWDGTATWFADG